GIDLGSTSLKAIVYDLDGNVVARGSRPTEKHHPSREHPEWTVWQPEQIWGGTAEAIRQAVAQLDDPGRIRAVAVTGMGMDGVPIDESGRWLYPFISWHDPRTGPQHTWWLERIGAPKTFSIGGNPVWPINSALRVLWMAEHEPEILRRTDKWLLIEDFVNFMLSGRRVTDYSMASCTMLFDQRTLRWSEEMLSASGIDRRLLPEALPGGTVVGEVRAEAAAATGLREGTPVVLGGHDHICGTLPVGAFQPGAVLDVTGTWEIVSITTGAPILKDELRQAGMTVQAHVAPGMHTIWGSNVAGEMVEWYRNQLAGFSEAERDADWAELMSEAEASPHGSRGVMFLPHMSSASCPMVDPRSMGAFVGLTPRARRGDLLRAIIEGLDYQFVHIVAEMERAMGGGLGRFIAVGGATRNAFWMQNKADMAGRTIEVPAVEEASPLGAAMLAGIGVGLYDGVETAYRRVFREGARFEPHAVRASDYARWFKIYQELYPAISPVSHQLFGEFAS
ncbi:MAG: FGGY-family carbohydrate kinase, partial [Thermoguttaceae bacterium]